MSQISNIKFKKSVELAKNPTETALESSKRAKAQQELPKAKKRKKLIFVNKLLCLSQQPLCQEDYLIFLNQQKLLQHLLLELLCKHLCLQLLFCLKYGCFVCYISIWHYTLVSAATGIFLKQKGLTMFLLKPFKFLLLTYHLLCKWNAVLIIPCVTFFIMAFSYQVQLFNQILVF